MRIARLLSAFIMLFALALCSCNASNPASASNPAPFTTLPTTQGSIIEYGRVDGATSLPAAMAKVLSQVHQACGEKPSVGQVFRVKGTNSSGVFFTVVDHAQGNRQLAGMVIAAQAGANQFEVGLVSDSADRFGKTANPMLQQLFAAWHPGETPSPSGTPGGGKSASTSGAPTKSSVPLHAVTASDNSATISVPDGWKVDPQSGRGAIIVRGPNGEQIGIEMTRTAIDPTNPFQVNSARKHLSLIPPGTLVYPFRGNIEKDFVNLFQAWRKAGGQGPAPIQVDKIDPMPAAQGNHCARATGHMNPDGKGMQAFNDLMCAIDPIASFGGYSVMLDHALLPNAVADKEQDLQKAIIATYKMNSQVVNQQMATQMKQKQQSDQQIRASAQQYIGQIHQIGQQATARMNATEAANSAEQAQFNQHEDNISKSGQGFSNYLLDQSVVQNNNVSGSGAAGHATVWNSTANALVKANPNKYEIVNTPNYWKGIDY